MISVTRTREIDHLKSCCHAVVSLESRATLPANRAVPPLCPGSQCPRPGRPRLAVGGIDRFSDLYIGLYPSHTAQERSLRLQPASAASKSAVRNVGFRGQFIVDQQLEGEYFPNSGLGRHSEKESFRELLGGQDQQCRRRSDAQQRTRRAIRPDVCRQQVLSSMPCQTVAGPKTLAPLLRMAVSKMGMRNDHLKAKGPGRLDGAQRHVPSQIPEAIKQRHDGEQYDSYTTGEEGAVGHMNPMQNCL